MEWIKSFLIGRSLFFSSLLYFRLIICFMTNVRLTKLKYAQKRYYKTRTTSSFQIMRQQRDKDKTTTYPIIIMMIRRQSIEFILNVTFSSWGTQFTGHHFHRYEHLKKKILRLCAHSFCKHELVHTAQVHQQTNRFLEKTKQCRNGLAFRWASRTSSK